MRADVNLSVREKGAKEFGTRTEMKNIGSFKAIAHAIEAETARQIDLIESGEKVVQETRRWNDDQGYSYAMRSKEDAQDYRYFPEPDLVPTLSVTNGCSRSGTISRNFMMKNWPVILQSLVCRSMMHRFLHRRKSWQISLRRLLRFAINQRKYPTGSWEKRCVC